MRGSTVFVLWLSLYYAVIINELINAECTKFGWITVFPMK